MTARRVKSNLLAHAAHPGARDHSGLSFPRFFVQALPLRHFKSAASPCNLSIFGSAPTARFSPSKQGRRHALPRPRVLAAPPRRARFHPRPPGRHPLHGTQHPRPHRHRDDHLRRAHGGSQPPRPRNRRLPLRPQFPQRRLLEEAPPPRHARRPPVLRARVGQAFHQRNLGGGEGKPPQAPQHHLHRPPRPRLPHAAQGPLHAQSPAAAPRVRTPRSTATPAAAISTRCRCATTSTSSPCRRARASSPAARCT